MLHKITFYRHTHSGLYICVEHCYDYCLSVICMIVL